jgi:hypothetical protein
MATAASGSESKVAQTATERTWFAIVLTVAVGLHAWGPNGLAHLLRDADSYWHVAAGRYTWTTGHLPSRDPFSHTVSGKHWIQHEWLADVIFAAAHSLAGWAGVIGLSLAAVVLALAILAHFLLRYLSGLQVCIIVLLAGLMMQGHVLARPHVFAWPIMAVWVATIITALEDRRVPPLWLALLLLLWANLHGSFVLGLGVLGLLGLEGMAAALKRPDRNRIIAGWILLGALAGAAGLITPDSLWNVLHILHLQSQEVQFANIAEWRQPDFSEFGALQVWIFLVIAVTWSLGARFTPARIVLLIVLLHMSLKHMRHAEWLGLISPFVLASGLAASLPTRTVADDPLHRLGPRALAGLRGLPVVAVAVYLVVLAVGSWAPDPKNSPHQALAAARAQNITGKVLNHYDFGGFLIFSGVPTFTDGRSDLYGDEFMAPYFSFFGSPSQEGLRALVDKYGAEWTLLRTGEQTAKLLDTLPDWTRVHQDPIATIHRKKSAGGFPTAAPPPP